MAATTERTDSLVDERALARTYDNRAYADPYAAVRHYNAIQAFHDDHPDVGPTGISRFFDLPKERVRPWLDGSKPHCVRGIETARSHGWLDASPDSMTFRGLNVMVAWVFSSGSITKQTWTPYFSARGQTDRQILNAAAGLADIEIDFTRLSSDHRAQELRPVEDGSVLGRVLSVLGAPTGEKNEDADIGPPRYLDDAPESIRQEFVQVYLHNRAQAYRDTTILRFMESRPTRYLEWLAALISELTDESVSVSGKDVVFSIEASRETAVWGPLLGVKE